ncbi:hypothetical protein KL930_001707 [Ogataea haglerorum]|uniref:Uncharacterized protein n=1 Tax=Ogataea haglerorum TaxID=1937702 RepID=A0AAN6D8H6_9ASCO|nr:uncharacterized protein KL911_001648 [Ogataea haglerorum]KAG7698045.1 hypothetical protein KL915_001762 [Ogataea haglerorum]KAG7699661.1 hypothetical protein KL951_001378 [Ogataea haglerorum]KAG7708267.1 hypothetical protein KL914_001993 [Ogataea haglerorum]KAG7710706.1 hypothetical protein KL950_001619 [Ogataea haglerorum]KAG7729911.1 hypothetical protein KL933_000991 [Ogataea haglerorum]
MGNIPSSLLDDLSEGTNCKYSPQRQRRVSVDPGNRPEPARQARDRHLRHKQGRRHRLQGVCGRAVDFLERLGRRQAQVPV